MLNILYNSDQSGDAPNIHTLENESKLSEFKN